MKAIQCEIKKVICHYNRLHFPQISTKTHVGWFDSSLSCLIFPPDHSEETFTITQTASRQKCEYVPSFNSV